MPRLSVIVVLLASLLFVTKARPVAVPAELKQGGMCSEMQCAQGCCTNLMCCKMVEQQNAPLTPTSPPEYAHVQIETIDLRFYTFLFIPPAPRRPFVILDEASTAHTLSPLAVSCIQLI